MHADSTTLRPTEANVITPGQPRVIPKSIPTCHGITNMPVIFNNIRHKCVT